MTLLDAGAGTPATTWDWVKVVAPLLTSGVVGAVITILVTNWRNRIQPVSTRLRVSTVDIPTIMPGYTSSITLSSITGTDLHHYKSLSTIHLELVNTGNKDLDYLDVGVTMPLGYEIIGVQHKGQDRYHEVTYTPEVSLSQSSTIIDLKLAPFQRTNAYTITLVVSGDEGDLQKQMTLAKLSKRQPVKFVDADASERALLELGSAVTGLAALTATVGMVTDNLNGRRRA